MFNSLADTLFVIWIFWIIGSGLCAMPCVTGADKILDTLEREGLSPIESRLVMAVFIMWWPICLTVALPWTIRKIAAISEKKQPPVNSVLKFKSY